MQFISVCVVVSSGNLGPEHSGYRSHARLSPNDRVNAKIITVSDSGFTSNLGTIGQAMAIRDKKVLAVGSNSDIRALAGPDTKIIDLKGRTVVPGFIR